MAFQVFSNDTVISTSYVPSFPVCAVIISLNLSEIVLLLILAGKSVILLVPSKADSSLAIFF